MVHILFFLLVFLRVDSSSSSWSVHKTLNVHHIHCESKHKRNLLILSNDHCRNNKKKNSLGYVFSHTRTACPRALIHIMHIFNFSDLIKIHLKCFLFSFFLILFWMMFMVFFSLHHSRAFFSALLSIRSAVIAIAVIAVFSALFLLYFSQPSKAKQNTWYISAFT